MVERQPGRDAALEEAFYDRLTTKHDLSKKPVLYGMSRGGLYVYNWAARHPDRVGLIYGDAAHAGALAPEEKELVLLRALRNQVVMAFRQMERA